MPSKVRGMRLTAIYFTHNNYKEGELEALQASDLYKYGIVGKEVAPETGTPHLQGYVQLKKRQLAKSAFNALAAHFGARPHMGKPDGSQKQNKEYCSKGGDFVEWGDARGAKQGNRGDLDAMRDAIIAGKSWEELAMEHTAAHARYHKWGEKLRQCIKIREAKEALRAQMEKCTLRTWQTNAFEQLAAQDDRKVLWVMDSIGGKGKSFLAKWLCVMHDAFYIEGGKKADISYAYDLQETVVFDLSRQTEEFVNYSTIESFKNGVIFSPKYESKTKFFKPARVIVFSNWAPDRKQLSADRWDVIDLDRRTMHQQVREPRIDNTFVFTDDTIIKQ